MICDVFLNAFWLQIVGKTFQYYWQTEGSCNQHKNRSTTYNNLKAFAGFIGAGESGVTIFSSKILQAFQIPQVVWFQTSFYFIFSLCSAKLAPGAMCQALCFDVKRTRFFSRNDSACLCVSESFDWSHITFFAITDQFFLHKPRPQWQKSLSLRVSNCAFRCLSSWSYDQVCSGKWLELHICCLFRYTVRISSFFQ